MPERIAIPADGVELAAERWASGREDAPVAVLLHAGVCDRRSWHGVAPLLAGAGIDVVAYDRRGFGETPFTGGGPRHLDDLRAVLDAVAPDRRAWLVGSSMGGALAIDLALADHDRVAGLVLIAPAVSGAPEPDVSELGEDVRRIASAIEDADNEDDLDRINRLEVLLWLDGPAGPEGRVDGPVRDLAAAMNAIALRSGAADEDEDAGGHAWYHLAGVRVPVTLAWGDRDVPFVVERCRDLAVKLPDVRSTHVFAGAAHLPYLERPDEVARMIAAAVRG